MTKDDRVFGEQFTSSKIILSDSEYAKLMKSDWNERMKRDNTKYTMAVPYASEEEINNSGYHDFNKLFIPNFVRETADILIGNVRVFEYGCGIGRMSYWIATVAKSLTAVDISEENIKTVKERLKQYKNFNAYPCSGESLSFMVDDKQFDYIYSYIVFQHIGSRSVINNILKDCVRLLDDGGTMRLQFKDTPIPSENCEGNTWHGSQIGVPFITRFCLDNNLEFKDYEGEGTEYFWVTLKKSK